MQTINLLLPTLYQCLLYMKTPLRKVLLLRTGVPMVFLEKNPKLVGFYLMDSRNHITDQFFYLLLERADSHSSLCKGLFFLLFIVTNSSNPHSTIQIVINTYPQCSRRIFFRWGNPGTINLPKGTAAVSGRAGIIVRRSGCLIQALYFCLTVSYSKCRGTYLYLYHSSLYLIFPSTHYLFFNPIFPT